jgi:hypothetical protein
MARARGSITSSDMNEATIADALGDADTPRTTARRRAPVPGASQSSR